MNADIFAHYRTHRGDLEIISSNLNWKLNVFNLARPNWSGTDFRRGNRIFYICEGEGTICQVKKGGCRTFRPSFAYFIPKNVLVELSFPPELVFYAIEFQLELIPGLDLFDGNTDVHEYQPAPEIFQNLSNIYKGEPSWKTFFGFEELRQHILVELLDQLEPSFPYMEFHRKLVRYTRLIDFIRKEASAQTTMEELAEIQRCSYDKLSRIFRADFKMTLKEMLSAELSKQAKMLLTSTDFSVKEIARKLKFSNEFNFSRFFKRLNGCSPQTYRLRCSYSGPESHTPLRRRKPQYF